MKLSVIVPAYNEGATIRACLDAVYSKNPGLDMEVIVVDDGSTDSTESEVRAASRGNLKYIRHAVNRGKGAAVRTALAAASGDWALIQDADLEYDPADYAALLKPALSGEALVVYGSRNLGGRNPRSYGRYYWGGRFLSFLTNLLYGSNITDEATGYKLFRKDVLDSLGLVREGFDFCPEATAKTLKRGIAIREVPISYHPRSMEQGKKIRWRDGAMAAWALLKCKWTG